MKQVDKLMRQGIANCVFPGAVLLVSDGESIIFFEAYGEANIFSRRPMEKNTIFDLASLTKPLATALAAMKLVERHKLDIGQHLGSILPLFEKTTKRQITIKHLLRHTSGLTDYRPYYEILRGFSPDIRKKTLRELLVKEPLIYPTGKKVLYSDIGFMILSWVVEHLAGGRLDHFLTEEIYQPLGLESLFFVDLNDKARGGVFAATEFCPWRKVLLDGAVHDDNAWVVGGIEGHAGLFGTATDVNILLSELLSVFRGASKNSVFNRDILRVFLERQEGEERVLGFDTPTFPDSSSGHYFSDKTVGHLGFTGTSFWMDLEGSVIVILLTNRIHPSRDNDQLKSFRPVLHDAVMENI